MIPAIILSGSEIFSVILSSSPSEANIFLHPEADRIKDFAAVLISSGNPTLPNFCSY